MLNTRKGCYFHVLRVNAVINNCHLSTVSAELPVAFMCALCQDTVDHPELIHPNFCIQHKFCDDCILKAFTFSRNCPVCVDSYGLTASEEPSNAAHNHTDEYDTKGIWPAIHHFLSVFLSQFFN